MGVIDLPLENSKFSSGINIPRGYTPLGGNKTPPLGYSITTGNDTQENLEFSSGRSMTPMDAP